MLILFILLCIFIFYFYTNNEKFDNHRLLVHQSPYYNSPKYYTLYHPQIFNYYKDSYNYGLVGTNKYNYLDLNQFYFDGFVDSFRHDFKKNNFIKKPKHINEDLLKDHAFSKYFSFT
jgi:hypothetical protein